MGSVITDMRMLTVELFTTYGKITVKQLKYYYNAVAEIPYNISKPIVITFNLVNDLRGVFVMAGWTYADI